MPVAAVTRHLALMLKGPLADTMTIGSQSTGCFFDDHQSVLEDDTGFAVTRRMRTAVIKTGAVSGLVEDAPVTVSGMAFQVRKVLPMDDGLLTRVLLARVD